MKANFKITRTKNGEPNQKPEQNQDSYTKDITKEEFEDFIIKSGAAGSFMIFRSDKKEDELVLEEL